jgi:hypothetical protein
MEKVIELLTKAKNLAEEYLTGDEDDPMEDIYKWVSEALDELQLPNGTIGMSHSETGPAVVKTIDVDTRWEQGIDHDPRSEEIFSWIADYDFKFHDDYFCWKVGGDGDNGEELLYELDEYFAAKDKEANNG